MVLAPQNPLSAYKPSLSQETLRQYGFLGMILEHIEAPEPLLAFYCHYHGVHQIPLARNLSPSQLEKVRHFYHCLLF